MMKPHNKMYSIKASSSCECFPISFLCILYWCFFKCLLVHTVAAIFWMVIVKWFKFGSPDFVSTCVAYTINMSAICAVNYEHNEWATMRQWEWKRQETSRMIYATTTTTTTNKQNYKECIWSFLYVLRFWKES